MDRAATEVETELLDLSEATLADLEAHRGFAAATERLLAEVEAPPMLGGNTSDTGNDC